MWIIILYKGKVCIFFLSFMHVFWVILNPYLFSPGAWGRNQRKSNSRLTGIIVMKMHWFYYFFLFLSFCCCFFLSYSICPSMCVCVCVFNWFSTHTTHQQGKGHSEAYHQSIVSVLALGGTDLWDEGGSKVHQSDLLIILQNCMPLSFWPMKLCPYF